jgi:hypothetical protein
MSPLFAELMKAVNASNPNRFDKSCRGRWFRSPGSGVSMNSTNSTGDMASPMSCATSRSRVSVAIVSLSGLPLLFSHREIVNTDRPRILANCPWVNRASFRTSLIEADACCVVKNLPLALTSPVRRPQRTHRHANTMSTSHVDPRLRRQQVEEDNQLPALTIGT